VCRPHKKQSGRKVAQRKLNRPDEDEYGTVIMRKRATERMRLRQFLCLCMLWALVQLAPGWYSTAGPQASCSTLPCAFACCATCDGCCTSDDPKGCDISETQDCRCSCSLPVSSDQSALPFQRKYSFQTRVERALVAVLDDVVPIVARGAMRDAHFGHNWSSLPRYLLNRVLRN
jgi:hypothetical protein